MDQVLPLLIGQAQVRRDQTAALACDAALASRQGQATLEQLRQFHGDCLTRSPGAGGGHADGQSLIDYQNFVSRLDEAITLQLQECQRRQERAAARQEQLLESQQRLMAFEALAQRRAAARSAKDSRAQQRDADEFGARAARRLTQESLS